MARESIAPLASFVSSGAWGDVQRRSLARAAEEEARVRAKQREGAAREAKRLGERPMPAPTVTSSRPDRLSRNGQRPEEFGRSAPLL